MLWSDSLFHGSTNILYNSVWFGSRLAYPRLLQLHICCEFACTSRKSASLWTFGSVSLTVSPLLLFTCICASLFSLSSFSPSPQISQALWLLTVSLSLFHTLIVHLTSFLWCLGECQAGRPWSDLAGNELLITSQETQRSTPTPSPSPHPLQHTHIHTQTYTAIVCSAHKEK